VSLRLQILQVARLAPRLLGESTDLVREFLSRQWTAEGGASDRSGRADLYYTIFALAGLEALRSEMPRESVIRYLLSFNTGEGLDFVHLGALARCWAAAGPEAMPVGMDRALLDRIESFRKPDGGYDGDPRSDHGTAYGAFVALGAHQDLGHTPKNPVKLLHSLRSLETPDGAWSNVPGSVVGATNATAGAVTLIQHLGLSAPARAGDWLLARAHPQGGFVAAPGAPIPDLLSTATVLHALAAMERRIPSSIHEQCLDFLDSLWSAEGGFHGHWADDHLDAEYTFYGLLALGHLSL
jgi:prenyltransferase beta subunit